MMSRFQFLIQVVLLCLVAMALLCHKVNVVIDGDSRRPVVAMIADFSSPDVVAAVEEKIPHRLIFTYKTNILQDKEPEHFYKNIMNTIHIYRQAWNDTNAPVWFLNDTDCIEVIEKVEPRLVSHFIDEELGEYKADICRLAALYDVGGYYFDVDMQAIQAVSPIDSNIAFVSVHAAYGGFFQSFLACEPGSIILKRSMEIILAYYEEKNQLQRDFIDKPRLSVNKAVSRHEKRLEWKVPRTRSGKRRPPVSKVLMTSDARMAYLLAFEDQNKLKYLGEIESALLGPGSLRKAYNELAVEKESIAKENTLLLHETFLQEETYPNITRQPANMGPLCNYIVHSPDTKQVYFYSRMVGVPRCHE